MTNANDLFQYINSYAPVETQMDFDNAGFLFGSKERAVHSVLLALDATNAVIEEAAQKKVQVLITHHPVIFHPVKSILTNDVTGRKLLFLAKNDISVISMHTNLDAAEGGVNDVLIRKLGAVTVSRSEEEPMMRIGELNEPTSLSDYLHYVKTSLHCNGIRYVDSGKPVRRIACLGGAGGEMLSAALHAGCDTFVTGDVDYHTFLDAAELGVNLIDADHFCTENPVMVDLQSRLEQAFPEVQFILSEIHRQTTQFYM